MIYIPTKWIPHSSEQRVYNKRKYPLTWRQSGSVFYSTTRSLQINAHAQTQWVNSLVLYLSLVFSSLPWFSHFTWNSFYNLVRVKRMLVGVSYTWLRFSLPIRYLFKRANVRLRCFVLNRRQLRFTFILWVTSVRVGVLFVRGYVLSEHNSLDVCYGTHHVLCE